MVAASLEALAGAEPDDEALASALSMIPTAELADALRLYARRHRAAALPVLRRCLAARPEWAEAAADALGTMPVPEAAATLAAADTGRLPKPVRTAVRRALYRLRQRGVAAPAAEPAPRPPAAPLAPREAWVSAVDGTGSRGVFVVLEGPYGERTLLSAVLNDVAGVLDFVGGPMAKRRIEERLRAVRAESPLPWVSVPAPWAVHLLGRASAAPRPDGAPAPAELTRWLAMLAPPEPAPPAPIHDRLPAAQADDPAALEASAELLGEPELAGWFLEPSAVQAEALELLQAKESRLVVSDQIRGEQRAAVIDRVVEAHFEGAGGAEGRRLWGGRLEEDALVFLETGRPDAARRAVAVSRALADPARPARRLPFVRALVERSLEVAGEVALGRVPAAQVSRRPPPRPAALP